MKFGREIAGHWEFGKLGKLVGKDFGIWQSEANVIMNVNGNF
jgi:hypothetical protein